MSSTSRRREAARPPPHLATGRFQPDECMSPAFFDDSGFLHFATHAPCEPFTRTLEEQWQATVVALEFVYVHIRKRQEEIDKKEYFADPTLQALRKRALAIHNRRIEINLARSNQERSEKVLDHLLIDVREQYPSWPSSIQG